jgi:hypothetical protein
MFDSYLLLPTALGDIPPIAVLITAVKFLQMSAV